MSNFFRGALLLLFFSVLGQSKIWAQGCDSTTPEDVFECQMSDVPSYWSEDCQCLPCPDPENCFGGDGGTEIPVPLDDYIWVLLGMGLTVGVWKLRSLDTSRI